MLNCWSNVEEASRDANATTRFLYRYNDGIPEVLESYFAKQCCIAEISFNDSFLPEKKILVEVAKLQLQDQNIGSFGRRIDGGKPGTG